MRFGTSASERMRIDSSGNVGIGTSSPNRNLHISSGVSTSLQLERTASGTEGKLLLLSATSFNAIFSRDGSDSDKDFTIYTGSNERMRIDSSGNVGINLANPGEKLDVAGNISGNYVLPRADNLYDLGSSSKRYNDLYLGGGLYVGGIGTANKLDDYEEGEFTPTYITSGDQLTSITYASFTGGSYVKVGRLVMITGFIRTTAITEGTPSGVLFIGGLPFAVASSSGGKLQTRGSISLGDQNNWDTSHTPNTGTVKEATSYIELKQIYGANDDASAVPSTGLATGSTANQLRFTGTYLTDA